MPSKIILIAAITADGYIAKDDKDDMAWSLDKALFKKQTSGYPIIMGSNTSRLLKAPLPDRENIIVHREDKPENIIKKIKTETCFVVGGGKTYTRFAPFCTHFYLSPHPLVFGSGISLFKNLEKSINLKLIKSIFANKEKQIYQNQYEVIL